jgi:hypothetical protein
MGKLTELWKMMAVRKSACTHHSKASSSPCRDELRKMSSKAKSRRKEGMSIGLTSLGW